MSVAAEDFITPEFLRQAAAALDEIGFVADDHPFAPFREALTADVERIEAALSLVGHPYQRMTGFLSGHPQAGYAYFIYDAARFRDLGSAIAAVWDWLDHRDGAGVHDA